ncbi:MAG: 4-hydroxy-3-methylbut-2-enyl diphosphate reductase [Oscillospiraceae bacterium]|nr:4-hydroxy-3-methylbut-2-enyl diphosphate reductase [Oscillospiraceae bacterium]
MLSNRIEIIPNAGYCRGVARAVRMAADAAPCYTLGPLIHNRRAVSELEAAGVRVIESVDELPEGGTLIIRTHGASPDLYAELEERGISYLDATCPDVRKIHTLVSAESEGGRLLLLFGDPSHPEVKATVAWCRECIVFSEFERLKELAADADKPITMAAQTTAESAIYEKCREFLKKEYTNAKILDTICGATILRQWQTAELSRRAGFMVVVGDPSSANTRHLAAVCECPVFIVEGGNEVRALMKANQGIMSGVSPLGVTAGASTPSAIIEEVVSHMNEELSGLTPQDEQSQEQNQEQQLSAEPTFEEMLEDSLRPLHTGEKITGVITGISPTEIQVDLGSKHAAYIPLNELTDDPAVDPHSLVKIGDEIETYIMRVNDVEGTAMLSKRRLDTVKSWEDVESAQESHAILEGIVVEENKGGVVVSVRGVRIFVPASQTGLPREAPMSDLLKQKVRLRVTEFHRSRRRVVGSIRSVSQEDRRSAAKAVWDNVEAGKQYRGVVKSMTAYGVFVDIGGVDGLVHLSELSWQRLKAPTDYVNVGDELDVTVISVDREKHRISLSHRKPEDNPWLKFVNVFNVGDVVKVKVNKLMAFGAFAEITPGVDGLIHISQLSDRRIGKPSEIVNEGDTIDVKITDIDLIRKKISLSARALIEPEPEEQFDTGPDEIVAMSDETETIVAEKLDIAPEEPPAESTETIEIIEEEPVAETAEEPAETHIEETAEEAAEETKEETPAESSEE